MRARAITACSIPRKKSRNGSQPCRKIRLSPSRFPKSAAGEFPLDTVGMTWKPGEGRVIAGSNIALLKPWLEDASALKVACDVKSAILELSKLGVDARGFAHDVMLYAFLLDAELRRAASSPSRRTAGLDLKLGAAPEQHADIALELYQKLSPSIDQRNLRTLYETIELPLAHVLARVERNGIRIDPAELKRLFEFDGDGDRTPHRQGSRVGGKAPSTSPRRSSWARCCS